MAAPRVYRAEAIVLKRVDFGEADKILTLYTANRGKMRALGKGIRRPGSRMGGHLDLLTHSQLQLARGRNLDIVTQAEMIEPFIGLRDDLGRASLGCQVAELVDRMTEDEHEDRPIFDALRQALDRIAHDADPELAVRTFEMTLLDRLGYRPQLHRCVRCRAELTRVDSYYSASTGGVLCPGCGPGDSGALPISARAFALLRQLQIGDYALLSRLRQDAALRREAEAILRHQIRYLLERELTSTGFVNRVRSLQPAAAVTA